MWLWAVELHELGFRRRSDRYWQCERRFGLPEQAHLSIFASEQRIPAGKGRKRCLVELAAFHVTFEIDRDNVHFYYHERLDNEWEAGGHTSAGEMARLGQELRVLRDCADGIAASLIEALGGVCHPREVAGANGQALNHAAAP